MRHTTGRAAPLTGHRQGGITGSLARPGRRSTSRAGHTPCPRAPSRCPGISNETSRPRRRAEASVILMRFCRVRRRRLLVGHNRVAQRKAPGRQGSSPPLPNVSAAPWLTRRRLPPLRHSLKRRGVHWPGPWLVWLSLHPIGWMVISCGGGAPHGGRGTPRISSTTCWMVNLPAACARVNTCQSRARWGVGGVCSVDQDVGVEQIHWSHAKA